MHQVLYLNDSEMDAAEVFLAGDKAASTVAKNPTEKATVREKDVTRITAT